MPVGSLVVLVRGVAGGRSWSSCLVLSVAGYLVTNWGFTPHPRAADGSWHLSPRAAHDPRDQPRRRAGRRRVASASRSGCGWPAAARLSAIVTGLDRSQQGSSALVPPAPRAVVDGRRRPRCSAPHAPVDRTAAVARARAPGRAASPGPLVPALVLVAARRRGRARRRLDVRGCWSPPAAARGRRGRGSPPTGPASLGPRPGRRALRGAVRQPVPAARGAGDRRTSSAGTFRSTWFQRRAGLTTLVATTAGGQPVGDRCSTCPRPTRSTVAHAGVPGLVEQFVVLTLPMAGTPRTGPRAPQ